MNSLAKPDLAAMHAALDRAGVPMRFRRYAEPVPLTHNWIDLNELEKWKARELAIADANLSEMTERCRTAEQRVRASYSHFLSPERITELYGLFSANLGVRAASRQLGIHRDTASRYRHRWIKIELQRAYDMLWDGDGEACDAITAKLPEKDVKAMLDAWLDDQCGDAPKSKWYSTESDNGQSPGE